MKLDGLILTGASLGTETIWWAEMARQTLKALNNLKPGR